MWDLPAPELKPVSPALAGGFLTTVPPGKPQNYLFVVCCCEMLTMNVSHLSNVLSEELEPSQSLGTVLHKCTDLHVICLILLLWLILFSPGENARHSELICSAIECIKLTPQHVD